MVVKYDAIEDTKEYAVAMALVQPILDREFNGKYGMGVCHALWRRKKQLLAQHGIAWRTPAELNTNTIFD